MAPPRPFAPWLPAPDGDILEGHRHQLGAFADWLDGGPPVTTTVDDNRHSILAVLTALGSVAVPPS